MSTEPVDQNENYVRIIAHEIRNPLTAIKMAGNFLKEGIRTNCDKEMLEIFIDITENNAKKIEDIVKKLLALKDNELSHHDPVDVCHIMDETLRKANDRIFLQNVTITKSYSPGHYVLGNAEKLSLAFLNIVVNAIESMESNEGKLWIAVYKTDDHVKIVFKDNGSGMEPSVATQIFDGNFSAKPGGFGFGLTHVKEILDEHHAHITVVSKLGVGTSVIVTFECL